MPVDVLDWLMAEQQQAPMRPTTRPNIVDPMPANRIQWQQPTMADVYRPASHGLPTGIMSYGANSPPMSPEQQLDVLDVTLDTLPGVGDLKSGVEFAIGRNLLSQQPLDEAGLMGAGAGMILPFIGGATAKKALDWLGELAPHMKRRLKMVPTVNEAIHLGQEGIGALTDLFKSVAPEVEAIKKTTRISRPRFGENLSKDGKAFMRWINKNRGQVCTHPNTKTGVSIDFSTDCPNRHKPCPYCYVEEQRVAKDLGLGFMAGKKLSETPYNGEIPSMPDDLIAEFNRDGGLRMFSSGDFRPDKDVANVNRTLDDARQRGLYIKAITKQPEFLEMFGDHPNLRINISTDAIPRWMSNAPTTEEAITWARGRPNIKIRAVAVNPEQAEAYARDPRIDVVTLYHGYTGDNLWRIIQEQNPELVAQYGEEAVKREVYTWQNMPANSIKLKELVEKYPGRICCEGGKCCKDKTKCGFGVGALIVGVHLPEMNDE